MRHASWLRRAEDPKTPLRWALGSDHRLPLARRQTLAWMSLLALAALVAFGYAFGFPIALAGAVLAAIGLAYYARPGAREHAALPDLGNESFPITIDVRHKGRRVGRENGWVAFVDGWLVYESRRTSFSFRMSDATSVRDLAGQLYIRLPEGGFVRMFLLTDFMQTEKPAGRRDRIRFLEAYTDWRRHPAPEGEPVFPPREVSPRIAGERVVTGFVLAALLVVLGLSAALLIGFWPPALLAGLLALGLATDATLTARRLRRQLSLPPRGPS